MSGECDKCGEHVLDCKCCEDPRLQLALCALNLALINLSILGYEIPKKLEFINGKRKENGMD